MRIHILGICGTFMGSLAQLAKEAGHRVSGSDAGIYPPMSDQLQSAGIDLVEGYDPSGIPDDVDWVVVGNAMSRGNPSVEYVLDRGIPYTSGPEWLRLNILKGRWVAAVAGTHGKTTTSSMLAWILEYSGMEPGFLIGGVPGNFDVSARLGSSPFFVIEADEYDTAFFDKRSKFVHYQPKTLVLNNLEFDHADIFSDLSEIERQFHHLVRTVPSHGAIFQPSQNEALERVIEHGCWSEFVTCFGDSRWSNVSTSDGSGFSMLFDNQEVASVNWPLTGSHSVNNGVAAILAARHMGVEPKVAALALEQFELPKRRMELKAERDGVKVFDDFAHHPTAIKTTLDGYRASMSGNEKLVAVLEPRSNTMKLGSMKERLKGSVESADYAIWFEPEGLTWSMETELAGTTSFVTSNWDSLVTHVKEQLQPNTTLVFMSNGSFRGLPEMISHHVLGGCE